MRRKQQTTASALSASIGESGPPSPASTGAMDTLLEKLRAAAPQTRDTRDRRRRARLNDRHQRRVASGQKMPDIAGVPDPLDEGPPLSPESAASGGRPGSSSANQSLAPGDASTSADGGAVSESEDVADRAASLMQSLRASGEGADGEPLGPSESLRVRRRRESADDERARRRRRRAGQTSTSEVDRPPQISIPEESATGEDGGEHAVFSRPGTAVTETESVTSSRDGGHAASSVSGGFSSPLQSPPLPSPPITIVSPPSPTTSESGRGGSGSQNFGFDGHFGEHEAKRLEAVDGDGEEDEAYSTPMEMPTPTQTPKPPEDGDGDGDDDKEKKS